MTCVKDKEVTGLCKGQRGNTGCVKDKEGTWTTGETPCVKNKEGTRRE